MCLGGGGEGSEQNVGDKAAGQSTEQHLSAAKSVEERGTVDGAQHGENGVDGIDEKLRRTRRDACLLYHLWLLLRISIWTHQVRMIGSYQEIRDNIVTRPLSEESHADDHCDSVSCSFCVVKLTEVPPWVFVSVQFHLLNDFAVLELNNGRVDVAFSVVFGEDVESFFSAAMGNEPSGRLWEEQDEEHGNAWKKALNQGGRPPGP